MPSMIERRIICEVQKKKYIMDITKDIVIAKLSQSAPNTSNMESGNGIADMFEAIYNKVSSIYFADNVDISEYSE
mgnify:CR=1 FL=1